jgi:sulfide:quinone oxidoreductase
MAEPMFRVLIAGGGIAGLETLMALRALAGDRVELMLVAPENDFVYRPLAVEEPHSAGRVHRIPLEEAAADADAAFASSTIVELDSSNKIVRTGAGDELEYEALVIALGAEPVPVVPRAVTWDDRADADFIGGFVQDFEGGYSRRLAVVIPPGPGWPLRGYEIALYITVDVRRMGLMVETTVVEPMASPIEAVGAEARGRLMKELADAGITVLQTDHVDVYPGAVVLEPSGQRLEVDRVVALPVLRGRPIAGLPADANGFIEVDRYGRVRDLDSVWAAGDGTAFPVKSGGFASEQADVVAEDIAALAGADVERRPFDPVDRAELLALPVGRHLTDWLSTREGEPVLTGLTARGLPVMTYLERDFAAGWRGR